MIPCIARTAVAVGVDGIFMEVRSGHFLVNILLLFFFFSHFFI